MIKKLLLIFMLTLHSLYSNAQQLDTDKLYLEALQAYRQQNFDQTLSLTTTALGAAPEYHDIRILQIRSLFALKQFEQAQKDIEYLLNAAPQYEGVKTLAVQRLHQLEKQEALIFIDQLLKLYGPEPDLEINKVKILLQNDRHSEARELATNIYRNNDLTNGQQYSLLQLTNLVIKNALQVTGQYIHFSEDYPRNDAWYALSAEYQRNFSRLALIGRITYSDRSYNSGSLYEVEAYPVFSENVYGFLNFGFSKGSIFPDYRISSSVFYNFATSFEAEMGFRSLFYNDNSYLTGIAGLTAYTGRFYLNARTFVGPRRLDQLIQNYQFNVRYYLSTPENYLFGRIGSGISPDEPTLYTRTQENPTLEAVYFSAGVNKTLGLHHVISLSGGVLYEDLPREETGTQFTGNLGYRYKF